MVLDKAKEGEVVEVAGEAEEEAGVAVLLEEEEAQELGEGVVEEEDTVLEGEVVQAVSNRLCGMSQIQICKQCQTLLLIGLLDLFYQIFLKVLRR